MINNENYINAWEKRVSRTTSHIDVEEKMLDGLKNQFSNAVMDFDFNDKSIIDIGCGGGIFGEWVSEKNTCQYSGMDISERSCNGAIERLCNKKIKGTVYLMPDPVNGLDLLNKPGFDVAVCFNVIQHIPDAEYYGLFFDKINKSGIRNIIMQFKFNGATLFQQDAYKTTHEINLACYTNETDIMSILKKYKVIRRKEDGENRFLTLELKRKK